MSDLSKSAAVAAELAKTSILLEYVQRKVPSVGNLADFTSRMTQGLKDQAEKNGGVSPFAAVFDQAKQVAPGASAEGFSKAQGFIEYLARETPGVFNQVANLSGDVLAQIQSHVPEVFDQAQKVGESVASFVSAHGPAVLENLHKAGGSILKVVHSIDPSIFNGIIPAASASAVVLVDGASVAGDTLSVGASQLMNVGMPNLTGIGKFVAEGKKFES